MLVRKQATDVPAIGDVGILATRLVACGFDALWYLHKYPDLRHAGLDPTGALFHFIMDGASEGREAVCGPLGSGLRELAAFPFRDRRYAARLVHTVFTGQLSHKDSVETVWTAADSSLVAALRAHGGVPFAVFGDSNALHYQRTAWVGDRWLAPLAFPCPSTSATGLLNERSTTSTGTRILDWARSVALGSGEIDLPIFLKFGGMDTELLWMMRRVRDGVQVFTAEQFDEFARYSVNRYGRFIERLCESVDRARLRVCTPFPSTLLDVYWAERFVAMQAGSDEQRREFAIALGKTEIPSLRIRTLLRRVYIRHLRAMCDAAGLRLIDDFSPLLGPDGVVQPRYLGYEGMDVHVDIDTTHAPILAGILDALDLSPHPT